MASLIGRIVALVLLLCIAATTATAGLKKATEVAKPPHRIMIQAGHNDPAV